MPFASEYGQIVALVSSGPNREQDKAMNPESLILVFRGGTETDGVARDLSDHYRIVEVDSVDDALRHSGDSVELVVADLDAANADSLQLLKRWKMRRQETPFVVLANGNHADVIVQAMKLGAADCLLKPVDPSQLRAAISTALEVNAEAAPEVTRMNGERPNIEIPPGTSLEELERAAVEQALAQHHGNRTHAAKTLGISVRTLQRKLKAWGMPLHSQHGGSGSNGPGGNIMYAVSEPASTPYSSHFH
jgi:DNA-binding NtrC family response regulator